MGREEYREVGPERPEAASPQPPAAGPGSGHARAERLLLVAGFVLAGLSLVLGFLTAIPAIVLGIVAITRGRVAAGATILTLAIALPLLTLAVLRVGFDAQTFRVPSEAMAPTLGIGDRFVTTRASDPRIGDILVFEAPRGALEGECGVRLAAESACARPTTETVETNFIKRVVAGPGDRVQIRGGRAVVNGETLEEPYIRASTDCASCNLPRSITIPEGHYFMLGDNRGESADSREWGPISEESVVGNVRLRYWPTGRLGSP